MDYVLFTNHSIVTGIIGFGVLRQLKVGTQTSAFSALTHARTTPWILTLSASALVGTARSQCARCRPSTCRRRRRRRRRHAGVNKSNFAVINSGRRSSLRSPTRRRCRFVSRHCCGAPARSIRQPRCWEPKVQGTPRVAKVFDGRSIADYNGVLTAVCGASTHAGSLQSLVCRPTRRMLFSRS